MKALESLAWAQKAFGEEETSAETMSKVKKLKEKYDISDSEEDVDSQEVEEDDDADQEEDDIVDFDLLLETGTTRG